VLSPEDAVAGDDTANEHRDQRQLFVQAVGGDDYRIRAVELEAADVGRSGGVDERGVLEGLKIRRDVADHQAPGGAVDLIDGVGDRSASAGLHAGGLNDARSVLREHFGARDRCVEGFGQAGAGQHARLVFDRVAALLEVAVGVFSDTATILNILALFRHSDSPCDKRAMIAHLSMLLLLG
jgi:hypothetical protein